MTAVLEHTVLPPVDATSTLPLIAVALNRHDTVAVIAPDGSQIALPEEIQDVLREVVNALSSGQAITAAPRDTILTTQQAADLLGVSRPTLVRLLEAGDIPFAKPGRHRRITLKDLIAYQSQIQISRRATIDAMTREAAQDDSFDTVNGFIQTR